ncbi:MAG: MFS transporter [Campylobacterales bacterium]|nr:MFS transporter [Campylobacterales bacterium]
MKEYILYALPAFSLALLGLPLYVYLPTFYAQDVGLGLFGVGLTLLVARLFDMLLDPLIGYWSDAYFPRKVFMLFGGVLLVLSFYFLTHPQDEAGYLWLLAFSVLVYFAWSLVSVPYYAMGADLGKTYEQNTHFATAREFFNVLGVLVALLLPFVFEVADNPQAALLVLFTALCIALPITLVLFFLSVSSQRIQNHFRSFKETLLLFGRELRHSKELFSAFLLNSLANAIPATLFLLYVELVLQAKELSGVLLLSYFTSGVVALWFWNSVALKTSKKTAWSLSMLLALSAFSFVPFLQEGDVVAFFIITIISGMSLGADMALPVSMQADVAQNSLNAPREMGGTLFGFFAMLVKLSLALGVGVSFGLLGLFEFDVSAPTQDSLLLLSLIYAAIPVCLKLGALYILRFYKETNANI